MNPPARRNSRVLGPNTNRNLSKQHQQEEASQKEDISKKNLEIRVKDEEIQLLKDDIKILVEKNIALAKKNEELVDKLNAAERKSIAPKIDNSSQLTDNMISWRIKK